MNFKEKYLKYKYKYNYLKMQIQTGGNELLFNDIKKNKVYVFIDMNNIKKHIKNNERISDESIEVIKNDDSKVYIKLKFKSNNKPIQFNFIREFDINDDESDFECYLAKMPNDKRIFIFYKSNSNVFPVKISNIVESQLDDFNVFNCSKSMILINEKANGKFLQMNCVNEKLYKIKQILKFKKDLKIDENVVIIAVENDDQSISHFIITDVN